MNERVSTARLCAFCKHPYINPCDGNNENCGNKLWITKKQANLVPVKKKKRVRLTK